MTTQSQYDRYITIAVDVLKKQQPSQHFAHQHNAAVYHYDHTEPEPHETLHTLTLYDEAETAEEYLEARSYGEKHGVWYWHQELGEWVNPPKKEWSDV